MSNNNLIKRLRGKYSLDPDGVREDRDFGDFTPQITRDAADRIEELEAQLKELKELDRPVPNLEYGFLPVIDKGEIGMYWGESFLELNPRYDMEKPEGPGNRYYDWTQEAVEFSFHTSRAMHAKIKELEAQLEKEGPKAIEWAAKESQKYSWDQLHWLKSCGADAYKQHIEDNDDVQV